MSEFDEELDVLAARITDLSKKMSLRFSQSAKMSDLTEVKEDINLIAVKLDDFEKKTFSKLDKLQSMDLATEIERLDDMIVKSEDVRRHISDDTRNAYIIFDQLKSFSKDKDFLEKSISQVIDLAQTTEKSAQTIGSQIKDISLSVSEIRKEQINIKDKIKKIESLPHISEEKLLELETQLSFVNELSERTEKFQHERFTDVKAEMATISNNMLRVEHMCDTIEHRFSQWDEKMSNELALVDGRIRNIEKGLIGRIEQVEKLEREQQRHIEHLENILSLVKDLPEKIRDEIKKGHFEDE